MCFLSSQTADDLTDMRNMSIEILKCLLVNEPIQMENQLFSDYEIHSGAVILSELIVCNVVTAMCSAGCL